MTRFVISLNDDGWEHGVFVRANTKEEALEKFKNEPQFRMFKNETVVSVESENEVNCVVVD